MCNSIVHLAICVDDILVTNSSLHVHTSLPIHFQLNTVDGSLLYDLLPYIRVVGKLKLKYLTHTWPDLAFVVQFLGKFMNTPCTAQWDAAMHTLGYIKNYFTQGLFFNNNPSFELATYCNSD